MVNQELNTYFPNVLTNIINEYTSGATINLIDMGQLEPIKCGCAPAKMKRRLGNLNETIEMVNTILTTWSPRHHYVLREVWETISHINDAIGCFPSILCLCKYKKTRDDERADRDRHLNSLQSHIALARYLARLTYAECEDRYSRYNLHYFRLKGPRRDEQEEKVKKYLL